jgi:hypothetical protein
MDSVERQTVKIMAPIKASAFMPSTASGTLMFYPFTEYF